MYVSYHFTLMSLFFLKLNMWGLESGFLPLKIHVNCFCRLQFKDTQVCYVQLL